MAGTVTSIAPTADTKSRTFAVPVTTGLSNTSMIEIDTGVSDGSQVVTQGQETLVDGDHVSATHTT